MTSWWSSGTNQPIFWSGIFSLGVIGRSQMGMSSILTVRNWKKTRWVSVGVANWMRLALRSSRKQESDARRGAALILFTFLIRFFLLFRLICSPRASAVFPVLNLGITVIRLSLTNILGQLMNDSTSWILLQALRTAFCSFASSFTRHFCRQV